MAESKKLFWNLGWDDGGSVLSGSTDSAVANLAGEEFLDTLKEKSFLGYMLSARIGFVASTAMSVMPAIPKIINGDAQGWRSVAGAATGYLGGEGGGIVGAWVTTAGAKSLSLALDGGLDGLEAGAEIGAVIAGPIGAVIGGAGGALLATAITYAIVDSGAKLVQEKIDNIDVGGTDVAASTSSGLLNYASQVDGNKFQPISDNFSAFLAAEVNAPAEMSTIWNDGLAKMPDLSYVESQGTEKIINADGSFAEYISLPNYLSVSQVDAAGNSYTARISSFPELGDSDWNSKTVVDGAVTSYSYTNYGGIQSFDSIVSDATSAQTLTMVNDSTHASYEYKNVDDSGSQIVEEVLDKVTNNLEYSLLREGLDNSSNVIEFNSEHDNSYQVYSNDTISSDGSIDNISVVYDKNGVRSNHVYDIDEYTLNAGGGWSDESAYLDVQGNARDEKTEVLSDGTQIKTGEYIGSDGLTSSMSKDIIDADGSTKSFYLSKDADSSREVYNETYSDGSSAGKTIIDYADGTYENDQSSYTLELDGSWVRINVSEFNTGYKSYYNKVAPDGSSVLNYSEYDSVTNTYSGSEVDVYTDGTVENFTMNSSGDCYEYEDDVVKSDGSIINTHTKKEVGVDSIDTTSINTDGSSDITNITSYSTGETVQFSEHLNVDGSKETLSIDKQQDGSESLLLQEYSDLGEEVLKKNTIYSSSGELISSYDFSSTTDEDGDHVVKSNELNPDGSWVSDEGITSINVDGVATTKNTQKTSSGDVQVETVISYLNGDSEIIENNKLSNGSVVTSDEYAYANGDFVGNETDTYADGSSVNIFSDKKTNNDGSVVDVYETLKSNGDQYTDTKTVWNTGEVVETIESEDSNGVGSKEYDDTYLTGNKTIIKYAIEPGGESSRLSQSYYFVNASNGNYYSVDCDGEGNVRQANGFLNNGDLFTNSVVNEQITGGDAVGSSGADILIADQGNGELTGGGGEDLYLFNTLEGNHVVNEDFSSNDSSIVEFVQNLDFYDEAVSRSGDDLLIQGSDGTLLVKNQFSTIGGDSKDNIYTIGGGVIRTYVSEMDGSFGIYQSGSNGDYVDSEYYADGSLEAKSEFDAVDGVSHVYSKNEDYSSDSTTTSSGVSTVFRDKNSSVYGVESSSGLATLSYIEPLNVYSYSVPPGAGSTSISDVKNDASTVDMLMIGAASDSMEFSRDGDSLNIQIADSNDSVLVKNWFVSDLNKTTDIITGDGKYITSSQVDLLIEAMASFDPSQSGSTLVSSQYFGNLTPNIAASLHN